ncbi:hypothetical protein GWI33_020761 [Rhynchophorus ferrugineus]|uniref:Uncharacterized protein n=1 Tax=Rhynchophorus ferrugineus TaxID=354439 RepID=A0A834I2C8_RHYFE|nr:hypothetical protein GWI33_020761 [Rhynchophorus ferrugineus]
MITEDCERSGYPKENATSRPPADRVPSAGAETGSRSSSGSGGGSSNILPGHDAACDIHQPLIPQRLPIIIPPN